MDFAYGAITLCGGPSQALWLSSNFVTPRPFRKTTHRLLRPPRCNAHGLTHRRFGLFPFRSPLLRESLVDFFSSGY